MLEKEWHAGINALIAHLDRPFRLHRPGPRAALASDDHPIDPGQIDSSDRSEKWLDREESHTGRRLLKMAHTRERESVLDRDAKPDVLGRNSVSVASVQERAHKTAALGEHLKLMPVRPLHRVKDMINKMAGYLLLKQIAHRVHENHPGASPEQRLVQPLRTQGQVKAGFKRVARNAAKAL